MAAGELEALLEVGGFNVDGDLEITMIQTYINVQKHNLVGGGMSSKFYGIAVIEAFKELVDGLIPCGQRKKM